jgi:hypothetical protein
VELPRPNEQGTSWHTTTAIDYVSMKSILFEILQKSLERSADTETSHNKIISYLTDSQNDRDQSTETDRFHKSFQKVIHDSKVFGRMTSSPIDLSLNIINELASRYVTAKELQNRSADLESWQLNSERWATDYHELLIYEENLKNSLLKLYEVRSHEIYQRVVPHEERITLYRKKYRVHFPSPSLFS